METMGSLIDKLSINELKIYHMSEQAQRSDVAEEFRTDCQNKLTILNSQKVDLIVELQQLIDDVNSGKRQFKLFRQMKMYNEKKFKD